MFPLEDRTFEFSKNVISVCRKTPSDLINKNIISQLSRAATSVGANYCEANGASSRQDFRNKIHICKKEAHESYYWLRLLGDSNEKLRNEIEPLIKESQELTLIFGKIVATMKNSKKSFNNQK